MESEHEQFSFSQPEADASNNQGTPHTEPGQNIQPEHEATAESAQNEAGAPSRHRRRRPTRGGARQSRAAATEQSSEEAEHEAKAETVGQEETPRMNAAAEALSDQESTAPANDFWQPEAEPQTPSGETEMAWGFQHWREQPPTDWNPFLPQTPEPAPFTAPGEPRDMTSDQETASWSSPTPEAALEGN